MAISCSRRIFSSAMNYCIAERLKDWPPLLLKAGYLEYLWYDCATVIATPVGHLLRLWSLNSCEKAWESLLPNALGDFHAAGCPLNFLVSRHDRESIIMTLTLTPH
jgi:hypothetical protein